MAICSKIGLKFITDSNVDIIEQTTNQQILTKLYQYHASSLNDIASKTNKQTPTVVNCKTISVQDSTRHINP